MTRGTQFNILSTEPFPTPKYLNVKTTFMFDWHMQSYPHRYTTWSVWRSECTCDIINTLSLSITASISYCLFTHYYYFLVTRILYVSSNLSISGICLFDKPFSTSFERSVLRSAQSSCCLRLLNEEGQCDSLQWMGGSSEDAAHEDGHCVLWVSFTPEARGRENCRFMAGIHSCQQHRLRR